MLDTYRAHVAQIARDVPIYPLETGSLRLARSACFLFIAFPGDFYAFFWLTSEFISHATRWERLANPSGVGSARNYLVVQIPRV